MIAFPEEQMFSLYALVSRIPTVLSNGLVTLTTLIGSRCNQIDHELAKVTCLRCGYSWTPRLFYAGFALPPVPRSTAHTPTPARPPPCSP